VLPLTETEDRRNHRTSNPHSQALAVIQVVCQGGGFFDDLRDLLKPKHESALVFSVDGETEFAEKYLLKHFYAILERAGIGYKSRNIVPYSLRHYMITERLRAGLL